MQPDAFARPVAVPRDREVLNLERQRVGLLTARVENLDQQRRLVQSFGAKDPTTASTSVAPAKDGVTYLIDPRASSVKDIRAPLGSVVAMTDAPPPSPRLVARAASAISALSWWPRSPAGIPIAPTWPLPTAGYGKVRGCGGRT